jgi:ABC-type transporter Mla MlaB component
MQKEISKTQNGVKISFTGEVKKNDIVTMVQNCQSGQCECMSDTTKQKIKDMHVSGADGSVALDLSGDISQEEIKAAMAKSKILNDKCC